MQISFLPLPKVIHIAILNFNAKFIIQRGKRAANRYLYDGDAEDVAAEADGDGADGHGGRAERELEHEAQRRKARPAR